MTPHSLSNSEPGEVTRPLCQLQVVLLPMPDVQQPMELIGDIGAAYIYIYIYTQIRKPPSQIELI